MNEWVNDTYLAFIDIDFDSYVSEGITNSSWWLLDCLVNSRFPSPLTVNDRPTWRWLILGSNHEWCKAQHNLSHIDVSRKSRTTRPQKARGTAGTGVPFRGKAPIQLKETWPVTAQVKTVSVFFSSYLISLTWFYLDMKFCNAKVVVVDSCAWHIYNERLIVFLSTYILLLTPSITWLTPDLTSWNML